MTRILAIGLMWLGCGGAVADACDRPEPIRRGLPRRGFDRVAGVVSGYIPMPPASAALGEGALVLIRVDEVVSGSKSRSELPVLVTITGRDCRSHPASRTDVERLHPIGTAVVMRSSGLATTVAGTVIVADAAKGGFVQAIPPHVVRTAAGDLDFDRFDAGQPGARNFIEFEFDRAVLTLGASRPRERLARVEQLAAYPGFARTPAARTMYRNLVVAAGASPPERDRLLADFDERIRLHPK